MKDEKRRRGSGEFTLPRLERDGGIKPPLREAFLSCIRSIAIRSIIQLF